VCELDETLRKLASALEVSPEELEDPGGEE
jgi:hypothetical protein